MEQTVIACEEFMKTSVSKVREEYIRTVSEAGFDGLDEAFLGYASRDEILDPLYMDSVMHRYSAVRDAGLCVAQTHLTFWPSHVEQPKRYTEYEEYMLPILKKEIELTSKMDCRVAVMHPYFEASAERSRAGNVALIEKLIPTLRATGVTLAVENVFAKGRTDAHHSNAEQLLVYVKHFADPHVGACLDTGHAAVFGVDPCEMLVKLGDSLTAIHAHSTAMGYDLHAIPLTISSPIDWHRFADLITSSGFGGFFNLEIKPSPLLSREATELYYKLAYGIASDLINRK